MNKFSKMFVPGALAIPDKLKVTQSFKIGHKMEHPEECILSCYRCGQVENQGSLPWCAAYSASSYAENILWRKRGWPEQIDPAPLYAHAKYIDGNPSGDGTSLECVLDALLEKKYFTRGVSMVKTFGGGWFGSDPDEALEKLKMTIFRYGSCIIGCNIDSSWYTPKNGVITGGGSPLGGHAVTPTAYTKEGVVILNSWGSDWGHDGEAFIPNKLFKEIFIYGACLTNVWNGMS